MYLEEAALPGVRPVLLLAVRRAQWPRAVPAAVHQAWQPLVARQADWLWVVVRPHRGRGVVGEDLSGRDVPGGHEEAAAALLVQHGVGQAAVQGVGAVLHLAGGGAVEQAAAGPVLDGEAGRGADHALPRSHGGGAGLRGPAGSRQGGGGAAVTGLLNRKGEERRGLAPSQEAFPHVRD